MLTTDLKIEPVFSAAEREELGHLDYFLDRLQELLDRELITPEAYATARTESAGRRAAIDRAGQYLACMVKARGVALKWPKQALYWAEQAIGIDQERIDAWRLNIDLCWSHEEDEAAIAWCAQGAEHVPELHSELKRLRAEAGPRRAAAGARAENEGRTGD